MITRLLACSLLATLAACAAGPVPRPSASQHVAPTDGTEAWVFGAAGATHSSYGTSPAPAGSGEIRAAATDQAFGATLVVYEGAIAFADVYSDTVDWLSVPLPPGQAEVGVRNGLAGITTESSACIVDMRSRRLLMEEDLTGWLKTAGSERADFLLPLDEQSFILVSSTYPTFASNGRVLAQTISRAEGAWQIIDSDEIPQISRMGAVASVDNLIYVSGIRENAAHGVGNRPGTLHQTLFVFQVDAEAGRSREVVDQYLGERRIDVMDLAAGRDVSTDTILLSILTDDDRLQVFQHNPEIGRGDPVYSNTFPGAESTAWANDGAIVVGLPSGFTHVQVTK